MKLPENDPLSKRLWRVVLRLVGVFAFVGAIVAANEWLQLTLLGQSSIGSSGIMSGVLIVVLMGYAVIIAMPFFPGVEIGIALLLMQGASVAPYVYLATVAGLFLAFTVGRVIPLGWLQSTFADLGLHRVSEMIGGIDDIPAEARLDGLAARLPRWLARFLGDWRYVTIGLLVNLPGSFALGGGGGILLLAGISRLFHPGLILITLLIAVLPVPLLVWGFGINWLL